VLPDRFDAAELARLPDGDLSSAIRAADARADNQRGHIERLEAEGDAPVSTLPFVFAPALDRGHVEALSERLDASL